MATDEALKRKLIARTARVWGRLNKRLVKELNEITQEWIKKLIWHAEREIASGDISNVPEFPEKFTEILQQGLREAFAYGYWLQELYLYERRGRKYKGKITLAEGDNVKDFLEDFMSTGEWNDIVPEDAVNWIRNYVPKLAGVLNQDSLELTRHILMTSMQQGLTLQERMKALREYVPEISEMAKHRIEAIARTEITRADSLGRIASAKTNEDAIGFEFSAIMDDRTTEICASRHGLVMRIDDPRLPENTPPLHVNCVLGDTLVLPVGGISACSKRVFNGDVFIIKSSRGNNLTCTPNHPILTSSGWVRACEIQEGDYVVCNTFREGRNIIDGKHEQVITRIKDITSSFFNNSKMRATPVPITSEDFHNDGREGEVAIIYAQRELSNRVKSSIFENIKKHSFIFRNIRCSFLKNCKSMFCFFFNTFFSSSNGVMCFFSKFCSFFRRGILHSYKLLLMTISRFKAILKKYVSNSTSGFNIQTLCNPTNTYTLIKQVDDSFMVYGIDRTFPLNASFSKDIIDIIGSGMIFFAQFNDGSTREIIFDKIVSVDKRSFHGFVYNLQTKSNIYYANNIITHNCRSLLNVLTIYDYPDGLLTSHEFDEIPHAMQRPEDIEEVEKLLRAEMQQAIEEIEAKTIKEANELAVKLGVAHNADFKGLDLSAANELIKGIVENKKIFPELPTFDFVGSCQNHNSFLRDVKAKKIFEKNADSLRKKNPNFSDEEILSAVKRQIKVVKVSFNTLAFARTNEGAKGISLNNAHFSTKEIRDLLDENNYFGLVNTVRLKYHPEGCATIKATIDHEIGHQIDNLLNVRTDMHILKLYNTNKSQMKENLSEYAGTMVEEFIAEAWSEYLNNENCRPLAKEVAERVKEIYKEKFKK